MSGIAGIVDLAGSRDVPGPALRQMARALAHRGPDEEGFHQEPGVGLAWRGLRINGPPGQGPLANEDGTVTAVLQGRLYNHHLLGKHLALRGHRARTPHEAEVLVHLWEDHGEQAVEHLRGQFAFALWDRARRRLVLARDRVGLSPLYWARRGDWLLFASEIKALLASGLVRAEADRRGLDHLFTFLALPAARTCFLGVRAVEPGHCLTARPGEAEPNLVRDRAYWDLDFPDRGEELDGRHPAALADQLEETLRQAVRRRLQPGAPLAAYVSGGVDCTTVAALAARERGSGLPTFTVRLEEPDLDETERARRAARAGGSDPTVVSCGAAQLASAYPRLVRSAESPVLDTACAALLLLAERAHAEGYKVALTGDGADDLFAGYPWFRVGRLLGLLDWLPGIRPSQWLRRVGLWWLAPHVRWSAVRRIESLVGGHHAWVDLYGLVSLSRSRFYSEPMREALGGHIAYEDLTLNLERMRRWHPLNQALYLGVKVQVPGLLLQAKGDRAAMRSAVEVRCPFLDEEVVAFSARLHPRWKLRRLRDKYLLRQVAARHLPADVAWRPKRDFLAPFDSTYGDGAPPLVEQLLSEPSLRRAGYFDPAAVRLWRARYRTLRPGSGTRTSVEIGLGGVVATQLWHHLFIDGSLADLPSA
jgi:asparagine synthase (glutamine-hydrolysing)